jgi:hypothetical protein
VQNYQKAAALHGQLIGAIKNAQQDGVYKQSEADYLTSQVGGNPVSPLSHWSSEPKVKELQTIKQQELNRKLDAYNLPHYQLMGAESPQQGQQGAPQTMTKNGVNYQKVPSGWQKVK